MVKIGETAPGLVLFSCRVSAINIRYSSFRNNDYTQPMAFFVAWKKLMKTE